MDGKAKRMEKDRGQMSDISTKIFETLRNELISLVIKPGDSVVESDICMRFSVTRPPVRSAFQRLSDMKLLDIKPYRGATATLLDLDDIYQIIFFRTTVEARIIQDFMASKPSAFTIEDLKHNLRLEKLTIEEKEVDEQKFFELDSALHQIWFDAMHAGTVWNIIQDNIVYKRFRMLDFVGTQKYAQIVCDHSQLITAIEKGESDLVLPILGNHLNNGLRRMGNLIENEYRRYFNFSENIDYWKQYNKRYEDPRYHFCS
jgi:DNA-binding GntR family transcriptional regulator